MSAATELGRLRPGPLRVPGAFLRRDRRIETSYKAGLLLGLASSVVTVGVFFFLSGAIGDAVPALDPYGLGYFAFVLLGIAASAYMGTLVGRLSGIIRESQTTGTLELMLLSPSRLSTIILSSTLWMHVSAAIGAGTYLVLGAVFGLPFGAINVPAALLATFLMVAGFTGLAILSGAFIIILKRGNPIAGAVTAASVVLGGVYYPVSSLPEPLQLLGGLFPMSHGLVAIRGAVLQGQDIGQLAGSLLALTALAIIYLVAGFIVFGAIVRFARSDGSLGQY